MLYLKIIPLEDTINFKVMSIKKHRAIALDEKHFIHSERS